MPPLSRRGFLVAAASAGVLAPAAGAAAASPAPAPGRTAGGRYVPPPAATAPAPCAPNAARPGVMHAGGTLGPLSATVDVKALKDVVALRYHLIDGGDTRAAYVVSYTDKTTTFSSHPIPVTLDAGGQFRGALYGTLDHEFLFYVDLPDGTTLTLGPLNRTPACVSTRRQRPPLYQPSPRHHGTRGQDRGM